MQKKGGEGRRGGVVCIVYRIFRAHAEVQMKKFRSFEGPNNDFLRYLNSGIMLKNVLTFYVIHWLTTLLK